jgi:hypothetical protein
MSVGWVGGIVNMDSSEGGGQIHDPAYSVLRNKLLSLLENQGSSAAA